MGQSYYLAMGRDGPGQSVKIWDGTRDGTITIFLSKYGTETGRNNCYFFLMISCFTTSFPVLQHLFQFCNILFLFCNILFLFQNVIFLFLGYLVVPGCSGTEKFVSGYLVLEIFLYRDKGITGRPVPDCPYYTVNIYRMVIGCLQVNPS